MQKTAMQLRLKALFVHLFTATGAVFAMLALLAAADRQWDEMFLWLVVALVVDGLDGPLARRYEVTKNWPAYDGVLLDLVIDYLTYVFIPAFALFKAGLLPGWTGWIAIIVITFASAIYFCDTRMKTRDKSFAGFPACWNMVVLVIFALTPPMWLTLVIVVVLAGAMFVNLKFVHPVRTRRWRWITLPVTVIWVVAAGLSAWDNFAPDSWAHLWLLLSSLYLVSAGILQQLIFRERL